MFMCPSTDFPLYSPPHGIDGLILMGEDTTISELAGRNLPGIWPRSLINDQSRQYWVSNHIQENVKQVFLWTILTTNNYNSTLFPWLITAVHEQSMCLMLNVCAIPEGLPIP